MRVKNQSVKTKKLIKKLNVENIATCASAYMKNRRLDNDFHDKENHKNSRRLEKLRSNTEYCKKKMEN